MSDKLVTIAKFTNTQQAMLAKKLLADFGIKSVVTGQHAVDLYHIPAITADLEVFESQAEKARQILESGEKKEK